MNKNSPVQTITGQVDVVYDKAIVEIEKEESDLESQIAKLVEKKSVLSRKSQLLNQLRVQVEQLTQEITKVEEQYETELKKKEELETLIQKVVKQLEDLKNHAEKSNSRLEAVKTERRKKYQLLAEMVEKLGDSVTSRLSDEVVADLEETIRISGGAIPEPPRESEPNLSETPIQDEETILEETTARMAASLNLDAEEEQENLAPPPQDNDAILEDDVSQLSKLLDFGAEEEQDTEEELDSVLEGLDFGLEEESTDQAQAPSPKQAGSTERERLAKMFSAEGPESVGPADSGDLLNLGAQDTSAVDSPNIGELGAASAQSELEDQENIEDLLKNMIDDETQQEEQATAPVTKNSEPVEEDDDGVMEFGYDDFFGDDADDAVADFADTAQPSEASSQNEPPNQEDIENLLKNMSENRAQQAGQSAATSESPEESDSENLLDFGLDAFADSDDDTSGLDFLNMTEPSAASSEEEPDNQEGIEDLLKNMIGDEDQQEEQPAATSESSEESDSDGLLDFGLDAFTDDDDDDTSEDDLPDFSELNAPSSPEDQGAIEDLLKSMISDEPEQEEQAAPKTTQTPRNRRNVLTSYLDENS